jgi:hypothetical protein
MTTPETNPEINQQSKLTWYVVSEIRKPQQGRVIPEYDEAIRAALTEPEGNTISVKVLGKTPQQIFNALVARAQDNNNDPDSIYTLIVAVRYPDVLIHRTPRAH